MAIQVGYACLALGVPGSAQKSCTLRTATPQKLCEVIGANLAALQQLVWYNAANGIKVFRISSDLIPFGSSPANTLPWQQQFAPQFAQLASEIAKAGLRVSMHPGQYTVLNSPDETVVANAIADLDYHETVLRLLGAGTESKLVLHVGGVYGDKVAALARFRQNFARLSPAVRSRLVLENDERCYHIADVLALAQAVGVPAVFDNLHHAINPPPGPPQPDAVWVARCAKTWGNADGRQKIHYSQQSPGGRPGAHSATIELGEFLNFCAPLADNPLDIMLEVKDKNISALKCRAGLLSAPGPAPLEREWARYKYAVLEHDPAAYSAVRALLKDKQQYPVRQFYALVDAALAKPVVPNNANNAALHVWGYFKQNAPPPERRRFFAALKRYGAGKAGLAPVKNSLLRLAEQAGETYLLQSYYFI